MKSPLIIFTLLLVISNSSQAFKFNYKKVADFEPLSKFKSVEKFEQNYQRYTQDCLDNTGGGTGGIPCYIDYKIWDRELNVYYKELYKYLTPIEKKALKKSQLAWLKERDSSITFHNMLLDRDYDQMGSMYQLMRAGDISRTITPIIKQRTLLLRQWSQDVKAGLTYQCVDNCVRDNKTLQQFAQGSQINDVWVNMREITHICAKNHSPQAGIINRAYCNIKSRLSIGLLAQISGQDVFISSPHRGDSFFRAYTREFAHYNPAFLNWVKDNILPTTTHPLISNLLKENYNLAISSPAKTFYTVYLQLREKTKHNTKLRSDYQHAIASGKWFHRNTLFNYQSPQYKNIWQGDDRDVATAALFWLRREMDGTAGLFSQILELLFAAYEPEFLENLKE